MGYRYYDTVERDVSFPFGRGLSYTDFVLSELHTAVDGEGDQSILSVNLQVTNVGAFDGSEAIQVYIQPQSSSVNRPIKELKGFKKSTLKQSEKTVVSVPIDLKFAVAFWDEAEDQWVCEKGVYTVLVGTSSRGDFLRGEFAVDKTFWWRGL